MMLEKATPYTQGQGKFWNDLICIIHMWEKCAKSRTARNKGWENVEVLRTVRTKGGEDAGKSRTV